MRDDKESAAGRPPSGEQYELTRGDTVVTATEVGGGLRDFEIGGVPVLLGYGRDDLCTGGRGQVLAPWPNRLEDGSYVFEGTAGTAALDEPEHSNAIHGLVRWQRFRLLERGPAMALLGTELEPQPGYPWRIEVSVRYELTSDSRLEVSFEGRNLSAVRAPFGVGFHPYLAPGGEHVDGCELSFAAGRRLLLDERGLPTGEVDAVRGTEDDFSGGRLIGSARIDACFTELETVGDRWSVRLRRGDGRVVELSASRQFEYLMCYTADTLPLPERRRGVAIEPMSCPPNAFRTGTSLRVLAPAGTEGDSFAAVWSLEAISW